MRKQNIKEKKNAQVRHEMICIYRTHSKGIQAYEIGYVGAVIAQ